MYPRYWNLLQAPAMASDADHPTRSDFQKDSTPEERWALIERVASSDQIGRSARLRDFLLYVGKQSLKEGHPEIREQEIGERVFGRSTSYDRSQDNIVRVNATELRKRIEQYFATTGADEPLHCEIPRGGYRLVFHRRIPATEEAIAAPPPEKPAVPAPPVTQENAKGTTGRGWVQRLIWPLISAALAVACGLLFVQNRDLKKVTDPWHGQSALSAFWGSFLNPHVQTDVVLPDDSVSVIEDITNSAISLDEYLTRGYIRRTQNSTMSADRKQDVYQIFGHNLVTFGGVRAAQLLLGEIPPNYPRYLTLTRNFTADEMKRDNVILIGGEKSVPWDHLFDDQLNFVADYDYQRGVQLVRNRKPKPGEEAVYTVPGGSDNLIGYAAIAFMPNLSQTGSVIILAGTDSDATDAAAAFLTSEEHLEKLQKTLNVERFPYFEVLLKTSRLSGTFFDAEPIAYRAYPTLPQPGSAARNGNNPPRE